MDRVASRSCLVAQALPDAVGPLCRLTSSCAQAALVLALGCGGLAADPDRVPAFEPRPDGAAGARAGGDEGPVSGGVPARPAGDFPGGGATSGTGGGGPGTAPDEPPVAGATCPQLSLGQIEIRTQGELEALRGCSSLEGDLIIYPFPGVDLTPLAELTRVGGTLMLGDPYQEPPPLGLATLTGLESLRSVGGLLLRGVQAPSLETFYALSELTLSDGLAPGSGFVFIDHCPALTDLDGLDNLQGLEAFVAASNERLTSLRGLRVPAELNAIEISDSPVVDIDALEPLTTVRYTLSFINTGLFSATALRRLSVVEQLQFDRNASLAELGGLDALTSVQFLIISENPSLGSLSVLERLTSVQSISVTSNAALYEVGGFPALQYLRDVTITNNALLHRASLSAVESAAWIDVSRNPGLEQLDLGQLTFIEDMLRVTHNPLLDSASLPAPAGGRVVIGGNRGEPLGLDPCPWSGNGSCESTFEDDVCARGADSDCPSL